MRLSIAAIAGGLAAAQAWENTSPFLVFSTSSKFKPLQDAPKEQLQAASTLLSTAKSFIESCPSDFYYIIEQPKLSPLDFHPDAMPHLLRESTSPAIKIKYSVSDVVGLKNGEGGAFKSILDFIQASCSNVQVRNWEAFDGEDIAEGLKSGEKTALYLKFDSNELSLAKGRREHQVRANDARIDSMLRNTMAQGADYTVIYISTPLNGTVKEEAMVYEAEFDSQAHIDLKRSIQARVPKETPNKDHRPLFEKYQFLTPGIFMGLITVIIMFIIISVGISAVSSLQVSYSAFDKENGPAAQKKQ
ncbi:BIG/ATPase V1 complex, subunit S1 [Bisporella sp. PMI_857]|nr:BIG/ATPase V1 complex, subunit S1 [Bisporella sp. PMI_857]